MAVDLVRKAGLPTDDLVAGHQEFWGVGGDELVGVIAWERGGSEALVRSFAVREDQRGRGWGRKLYQALESAARQASLSRLVLLTETAERFFSREGFTPVSRDELGPEIRSTAEFTGLCPVSAVCLAKSLR